MVIKKFKSIAALGLLLSLSLLTSCSDDDDPVVVIDNPKDIIELASATPSLSILVDAVVKADLVDALKMNGPYTVFAPNNDAFAALLDSNDDWSTLNDIPTETLATVLKFHVLTSKVTSADLSDTYVKTLATGPNDENLSLQVETTGGVEFNGDSKPITVDVEASNGVVHIIDKVMLPPSLVTLALNNSGLTSLVAALTDTRHTTDFVSVLNGDGPFTVFAPTNAAFQSLLDSNDSWSSLGDIPIETLDSVLRFHVLSGANVQSAGLSDTYVNTLATGPNDESLSLQIKTTGGVEFNGDSKPVIVDIQGSNGVVHVIDKVMLPANIVTLALNNSGFTSLVAALTDDRHTTDFVAVLNGGGPFTVFAPTNAAFQALLDSNDDWNGLGDVPIATLDAVLKYHVVNGANVQADQLSDNQEITMLSEGMVTVDLTDGAKLETSSGQSVVISVTDVQGTNGVIHAINNVLLP